MYFIVWLFPINWAIEEFQIEKRKQKFEKLAKKKKKAKISNLLKDQEKSSTVIILLIDILTDKIIYASF